MLTSATHLLAKLILQFVEIAEFSVGSLRRHVERTQQRLTPDNNRTKLRALFTSYRDTSHTIRGDLTSFYTSPPSKRFPQQR